MRERNIYHQIEAGKTELSAGHIKCEFCGKLFLNEDYFNAHVDKKHAKVYVFVSNLIILKTRTCPHLQLKYNLYIPINYIFMLVCHNYA